VRVIEKYKFKMSSRSNTFSANNYSIGGGGSSQNGSGNGSAFQAFKSL
jgi:hypothetical protein